MKLRIISLLLIFSMVISLLPLSVYAADSIIDSGTCGDNTFWSIDSEYTLTITGEGDMYGYSSSAATPWSDYTSQIKKAVVDDGITNIGIHVFSDMSNLISVEIPETVTTIGAAAFENSSSLLMINLPPNITNIDNYVFRGCSSLIEISIPENVEWLGMYTFAKCTNLQTVYVPYTVYSMGLYTFDESNNVTIYGYTSTSDLDATGSAAEIYAIENNIPFISLGTRHPKVVASGTYGDNIVWSLDDSGLLRINGTGEMIDSSNHHEAWRNGNYTVTSVEIGNGITSLGLNAFVDCSKIVSISLPDSLLKISGYAFSGCIKLESIVLPQNLTSIGYAAFQGCRSLRQLHIPANVEFIGYDTSYQHQVFANCFSLREITVSEDNTNFSSVDGVLFNNDMTCLLHYPIGNERTSYEIPTTVTSIYDSAFNCSTSLLSDCKLTEVVFPKNLKEIGTHAFSGCANLTSVDFPVNLTTIKRGAFSGCIGLSDINIDSKAQLTSIGDSAFADCTSIETITFPASVSVIESAAFSGCTSLVSAYFEGNAFKNYSTSNDYSIYQSNHFPSNITLYYLEGTVGWTDNDAYDSESKTWNGYNLECYGSINNTPTPDITAYTRFGQYNGSTLNYVTDPVTGFGKNLMKTVTIDGITYDVADTCEQEALLLPTDYLGNYYYIAYNLNSSNEVSEAKIMPGIVCTLEGYDPATKVVDTDYEPIIPVGEDRTLPSGNFYVSDVTASSFPTDEIGSWVGDQVRIYCVGEQIFKAIHIVEDSGTITNFDALSTPQVVYIDNIPFEVINDLDLVEAIRANIYKNANFTRYDNTIIALNGYEAVFEWNITPTIDSLFLSFKIDGLYELGNGKMQIRDYKTDSIVTEISTEFFDCLYDSDDIGAATETEIEIAVFHEYSFDFDTEYYITISNDFLTEIHSGSPLNSYYFTNKDNSYWRTPMDVWRHHNYGDRLEKKLYTDMYGAIDGNVLYSRAKDAGTGGLCAGFVISTWSFYLKQTAANEFYQIPPANTIWDINLDSILNDVGFDADEYIKRAFILQFLPDIQEQKSKNLGNLSGLYDAVKKAQKTNTDYVYISVRGASGGHALWGHRVEDFGNYSIIYVYDCNTPEKTRELYLYGSYPNFTSFAYPDETLFLEDEISYVTGVDNITRYLKNIDTLNLPYDIIFTDATQFTVSTINDETATYNNAVVSGNSSVIIPVISIDTGFESQNSTIPMHWIAENSLFETCNTTSSTQSITYSANNSVLGVDLNAQDRIVIDTTTANAEMLMQMDVNVPTSSNIVYSLLMDGKLIDITVEGIIQENFTLTGYSDRIVIGGIENPKITMDDGDDVTQQTVDSDDDDSIEIAITDTGDDCEMDIDVTENTMFNFTITFDGNGGYTTQTIVTTNSDGRISIMPTATRNGYTFDGWYTDPVTGTQITTSTVFTSNTTVYAHWTKETISGFDEDYWYWALMMLYNQEFDITASATEGGTITPAGTSKVKYDKNITYTITPDEGYAIADVLINGESVGAVSEYTIKRIKKDQTIHAIFVKTAWENPYTDVSEEAWYYEDVKFVSENGLMIGTGDNKFSPKAIVNRAMLVTVLWRLEGSPVVDSPVDFYDVLADEWYTAAVNWAAANGIVNGYGDGIFGAMNDLTHEQIMAILNRYAVYKKWSENVSGNADESYTNSEWAENNVLWADLNGMFDGIGSDISDLTEGADRAELAAYLRRFCERFMAE